MSASGRVRVGPGVSAIILAGGRSSRFGSDKLEADLEGRGLLDRVIAAARELADEVVVVGRAGQRADVTYVPDAEPGGGPLAGLATGARSARRGILLVLGGDMPRPRVDVLRLLVSAVDGEPGEEPATDAAVLEEHGAGRPLPLAGRRDRVLAAGTSCLGRGERSLRAMLAVLDVRVIPEATWRPLDPPGLTLLDVDTPADLEQLRGTP